MKALALKSQQPPKPLAHHVYMRPLLSAFARLGHSERMERESSVRQRAQWVSVEQTEKSPVHLIEWKGAGGHGRAWKVGASARLVGCVVVHSGVHHGRVRSGSIVRVVRVHARGLGFPPVTVRRQLKRSQRRFEPAALPCVLVDLQG